MTWLVLLASALAAPPTDLPGADVGRRDLHALHAAWVGDDAPAPPPDPATRSLMQRALAHPEARVRRIAAAAFLPLVAPTVFDPEFSGAPALTARDIDALARDPDPGVRRRALHLIRGAHPSLPAAELAAIFAPLLRDPTPGVRALAIRCLPDAARRGLITATDAWAIALEASSSPAPAGRAACNQLAALAPLLDAAVDPVPAMERCLAHHPERAWRIAASWGARLPAREDWMRRLLHETLGLSPGVVASWAERDAAALHRQLDAWPVGLPTERRDLARRLGAPAP
jgi:hypothetical protein